MRIGVHLDELVACVKCGAPLASAKLIRKVTASLGSDAKFVEYCPNCKKQLVVEAMFGGKKVG